MEKDTFALHSWPPSAVKGSILGRASAASCRNALWLLCLNGQGVCEEKQTGQAGRERAKTQSALDVCLEPAS